MDHNSKSTMAALRIVLSVLPLHAEEGRLREVLPESELLEVLQEHGISADVSAAIINTIRRQFEALALLDPVELADGKWAFISFPASLLGFSWLTTLATPEQVLLPAGYWGQDASEVEKEEQRALLHRIETGRLRLNPKARPIRVVHVSWAWIRIGEMFLMHHREDKDRPGEKTYGLPGGRFNLDDVPHKLQAQKNVLREIFETESQLVAQHISATLERELREETDLTAGEHYTYAVFGKPLPPYEAVNGAGNRHAYSAYKFYLYEIKLTHSGETHLLRQISKQPDRLKWFSAEEMGAPQRPDGTSAYVDALHQAWGTDFRKILASVPDSQAQPLTLVGESMMLDLPGDTAKTFQIGKPGKEKGKHIGCALEEAEWQLLMLLGWHARGYPIQLTPDSDIRLLGNNWIEAPSLTSLARSLLEKTKAAVPGLVEIRENTFLSLRIAPEILFFHADLFRYQIFGSSKAGGKFDLKRLDLITPWAFLQGEECGREINGNTVDALRKIEKGDEPSGDWERSLRQQFGELVRSIGLRRLWSTKGNIPCLVEGLERIAGASPKA